MARDHSDRLPEDGLSACRRGPQPRRPAGSHRSGRARHRTRLVRESDLGAPHHYQGRAAHHQSRSLRLRWRRHTGNRHGPQLRDGAGKERRQCAHPQERARPAAALDGARDRPRSHRTPPAVDRPRRRRQKGAACGADDRGSRPLRRNTPTTYRSTCTVRARGNANCSPTCLAAFCTASHRSTGRGAASNS